MTDIFLHHRLHIRVIKPYAQSLADVIRPNTLHFTRAFSRSVRLSPSRARSEDSPCSRAIRRTCLCVYLFVPVVSITVSLDGDEMPRWHAVYFWLSTETPLRERKGSVLLAH